MGGRSRIRWHKVAKLALAGFGCLALFTGLPSLIRRPEPPPLDPDIGFAHVAEPRHPAPSRSRSKPGPRRRVAKDTAPMAVLGEAVVALVAQALDERPSVT